MQLTDKAQHQEEKRAMKKSAFFLSLIVFAVFASAYAHAQKYEIGADVAVKVQYIRFMDSTIRGMDLENGVYVGVEAYKQFFLPNLYFGIEAGWTGTSSNPSPTLSSNDELPNTSIKLDLDMTYVPIEFNTKYVIPINHCLNFDIGAGFSYNYIRLHENAPGIPRIGAPPSASTSVSVSTENWIFGGQFFAELNYKFKNNLYMGIAAKYQLTEDTTFPAPYRGAGTSSMSADNFRVGMQMGYMF
jgi:hypothetical protein